MIPKRISGINNIIRIDDWEMSIKNDFKITIKQHEDYFKMKSIQLITLETLVLFSNSNECDLFSELILHPMQNKKCEIIKYYVDQKNNQLRKIVYAGIINSIDDIARKPMEYKIKIFLKNLNKLDTFAQRIHKKNGDKNYNIFGEKIKTIWGEVIWNNERWGKSEMDLKFFPRKKEKKYYYYAMT